jgi:hypothetical protein
VLLTAMLTALAVGTLLVSAAVLAPGVAESAFRQTIADSGAENVALTASTALDAPTWSATDAAVRQAAAREPQLDAQVTAAAWTTAYSIPGAHADTRVAVGSVEAPAERAELSEGRWASPGAEVLEVTVHEGALDALDVEVGHRLVLDSLVGSGSPITVQVVGSFRPVDPADGAWRDYAVGVRPAAGSQLALVGPVLADIEDLLGRIQLGSTTAAWSIELDTGALALSAATEWTAAFRTLVAGKRRAQDPP